MLAGWGGGEGRAEAGLGVRKALVLLSLSLTYGVMLGKSLPISSFQLPCVKHGV